jgi:hypothetical protein
MLTIILIICIQVRFISSAPLVPYSRQAVTVTQEPVNTHMIENNNGYLLINKTNIIEREDNEDKEENVEKEEKVENEGKKEFQIPPVLKLLAIVIILMIILMMLTEWADLGVLLETSKHHMIIVQM